MLDCDHLFMELEDINACADVPCPDGYAPVVMCLEAVSCVMM